MLNQVLPSALAVLLLALPAAVSAQTVSVTGRITDGASGQPVSGATVELAGISVSALTNQDGQFRLARVSAGRFYLRVTHIAYGTQGDSLTVGTTNVALAVRLLPRAIQLEPLPVQGERERTQVAGTYLIRREQIEALAGTARHLGDVVRAYIPGATVYETRTGLVCLEFRGARGARIQRGGCNAPVVVVDHVPIPAPGQFLRDTPPEDIERIEFVPASQGAARYGLDSQYGALVIQTRHSGVGARPRPGAGAADVRQPTYPSYQWQRERRAHPWQRTLLASAVGNAAGAVVGLGALGCLKADAGACLSQQSVGTGLAALTLPMSGAAAGARIFGATDLSHGSSIYSAAAAAIPLLLGYGMYRDGEQADFGSSRAIGFALVFAGAPIAATLADGLFRRSR
ncbi:MAG TPA: TonB-dependent receptor [Longimicrobiales bacterium]|nr:TonB-dependent receptor [Longimicrobiales bacterium]